MNNFEAVAREWWEQWRGARSNHHAESVMTRMKQDVFPAIGARPVSEIEAAELVAMRAQMKQDSAGWEAMLPSVSGGDDTPSGSASGPARQRSNER